MKKHLDEILNDMGKSIEDFFGVDQMDTGELRDIICTDDSFTNMQESIANEIGIALSEMTEKNYGNAFTRVKNLQNELIEDVKISKGKEIRYTHVNS